MFKGVAFFSAASLFNGVSWWALLFGQTADSPFGGVVQLVGTGGLIVCLLTAVVTLWKDRNRITKEHKQEIEKITTEFTKQLKQQIEELKEEAHEKYEPKIKN